MPEAYSEPSQTSKMELFAEIATENGSLFSLKSFILDIWLGSACTSEYLLLSLK